MGRGVKKRRNSLIGTAVKSEHVSPLFGVSRTGMLHLPVSFFFTLVTLVILGVLKLVVIRSGVPRAPPFFASVETSDATKAGVVQRPIAGGASKRNHGAGGMEASCKRGDTPSLRQGRARATTTYTRTTKSAPRWVHCSIDP